MGLALLAGSRSLDGTPFLITSEGDATENPRHQRKAEKQLKKAQRRVSRRKKGSKRRKKLSNYLLAKKHQHVQRQRSDFHHKTALSLLRAYDTIYLEDVQVANMVRNRRLAKASLMLAGLPSVPSLKPKQCTLGVKLSPCGLPLPHKTVAAVGHASSSV